MIKKGSGTAKTRYLSIPSKVAEDTSFPFTIGEKVFVSIDAKNQRLLVEKANTVNQEKGMARGYLEE